MTNTRTFLVTAASGRIGGRVALSLLEAGQRVRVVARERSHLAALQERGAEPAIGDLRDAAFAHRAFAGIDNALLTVRADRGARDFRRDFAEIGRRMDEAIAANRVPHAVFVSALGAHHDKHRGLILVHRDVELALADRAGVNVTFLRAPFFAENLLYFVDTMREKGGLYTPLDPDVAIDVAPTAEIAALALRLLLDAEPGTRPHELRSPAGVTLRQVAGVIAALLGRPFPVGRTSRDADVARLVAGGSSHDFAHLMNDAWDTYSREGRMSEDGVAWTASTTPLADLLRAIVLPRLS
jgi:uncharacterized protein YbjT (DUF2867 family)